MDVILDLQLCIRPVRLERWGLPSASDGLLLVCSTAIFVKCYGVYSVLADCPQYCPPGFCGCYEQHREGREDLLQNHVRADSTEEV